MMKSTGNNSFYQYVSSSLSEIGPNIGGIFSQERVASGDRTAMVAKTVTTPATLVRYSGSGLAKSSGSSPINIQAVRLWNDDEGKEEKAVLDFSDADVDLLDSLEGGNVICAVKVNQPANSVIRQNESNTALAVSLYRNGNIVRSYSASVWRNLSLTSLPAVQEGDVITFSLSRKNKKSGFNIVELKDKSFEKKITGGDILIPTQIAVGAYPNPFNPSTTFRVSLPQATNVRLAVYNMLGQKVAALVDGMVQAGYNDYRFDGSSLSSGIYLYRMEIAKESEREIKSGKIMLVK
ncbi:MAG: T9SS type A sorting domain-containing protein [Ignavibacteriales bacterium]|nr:T9SS type A sorting domain-containing protein [Ignavibacteriales bacterium]